MKPIVSTKSLPISYWITNRELVSLLGDSHNEPTKKGMKNHVLVLRIWKACRRDEAVKVMMKMTAAAIEGSYL